MDQFQETADLFTVKLKQEEVEGLEDHWNAVGKKEMAYGKMMQGTHHAKQFQAEAKALVHTKEFMALAKFAEAMKKKGPSAEIKAFAHKYKQEVQKLEMLHMKLKKSTHANSKMVGQDPHHRLLINVDDDEWYAFNVQYYKIREMEYYAGYKIKEVVALRKRISAVRHTHEMEVMQGHFAEITQSKAHQAVVKAQGELLMHAVHTLHMSKDEEKWLDPSHSPVMFDVWHLMYVYFVAMGKGDLNPMLDFIIDGKYDEKFVHKVNPKFPAPKNYPEDLYLY
jgi:hypothetical protein